MLCTRPVALASRAVSLYRALLRAHRTYLPADMRDLGDVYVHSEFRLHKNAKPEQVATFLAAWEKYLEELVSTGEQMKNKESLESVGSLDDRSSSSSSSSSSTTTTTRMRTEATDRENSHAHALSFGKHLPLDIELSKEQQEQLEKLKLEAAKLGSEDDEEPRNS